MKKKILIIIILIISVAILKGLFKKSEESFFTEMIDNYQTDMVSVKPSQETLELLQRFQPKVYVDKKSYKPVYFYEGIVENSVLKKSGYFDERVSKFVSQSDIHDYARKSLYYLDYQVSYKEELERVPEAVPVYGRVYKSMFFDKELTF